MTFDQKVLNGLLGELSHFWQLDDLTLDQSGRCSLITEEDLQVAIDLPAGSTHLQLLAGVGFLNESYREQQLTTLMQSNFDHPQLCQAYFALSPESDCILLRYLCSFEDID
ncbi:Tir chaperone family protein, partial [Vibrio agarivorans]